MKTRLILLSFALLSLLAVGTYAQKGVMDGSTYGKGEDSVQCLMNLSLYYEFYKHNNYNDAIGPWRIVFNECPASRESLYAYGVIMYRSFLEKESDPVKAAAYCDTIMMIYDQRIKYFGDEGNVLGRKGVDLLRYRRNEGIEFIKEGYNCLKRSIEIDEFKSSPVVLTTFMSASISLFVEKSIDNEQVINDYILTSSILDRKLGRRADTRTKTAKEVIDSNIRESGALTCDAINNIYGPKFEQNKDNLEFLLTVTEFLTIAQCESEKLFADASVNLYELQPSADAAHNLARLFLRKENYTTARKYYLEAIERTTVDDDKALYYYELALLTYQYLQQNVVAVNFAFEATRLKPEWGDPYILIGTIYLAGKNDFSDQFEQQAVYWFAVDMFQKALNADSSVADKASNLVKDYSQYFPSMEDLFFRSIKEGDPYTIKGWINKTTTARARRSSM